MSTFTTLTQLIAFGLFGGDNPFAALRAPLSDSQWRQLFDESRRQAVTALLYDAILMLPHAQRPSRGELFRFTSMTETIENDNRHRDNALLEFQDQVMQPLGLSSVVVKGSSLASRYPQPLHRECGDNDLYTGSDTERLCSHLESLGIEVDRKDPRHAAFDFQNVGFEAHSYLLYHGDDPRWGQIPFKSHLSHLPAEEEAYFLAKHIEHHAVFFHKPVHLRDLVDWSMMLLTEGFDMQRLRLLKEGSDVDRFAELMSMACNSMFGLNIDCRPPEGMDAADFYNIYMQCPERHKLALVRVARRSWKYIRYGRKYRTLYGQSMFRRFYFRNLWVAVRNKTCRPSQTT